MPATQLFRVQRTSKKMFTLTISDVCIGLSTNYTWKYLSRRRKTDGAAAGAAHKQTSHTSAWDFKSSFLWHHYPAATDETIPPTAGIRRHNRNADDNNDDEFEERKSNKGNSAIVAAYASLLNGVRNSKREAKKSAKHSSFHHTTNGKVLKVEWLVKFAEKENKTVIYHGRKWLLLLLFAYCFFFACCCCGIVVLHNIVNVAVAAAAVPQPFQYNFECFFSNSHWGNTQFGHIGL